MKAKIYDLQKSTVEGCEEKKKTDELLEKYTAVNCIKREYERSLLAQVPTDYIQQLLKPCTGVTAPDTC